MRLAAAPLSRSLDSAPGRLTPYSRRLIASRGFSAHPESWILHKQQTRRGFFINQLDTSISPARALWLLLPGERPGGRGQERKRPAPLLCPSTDPAPASGDSMAWASWGCCPWFVLLSGMCIPISPSPPTRGGQIQLESSSGLPFWVQKWL